MKDSINFWRSNPEDYFHRVLGIEGEEPYNGMWDGQYAMLESIPICIDKHKNLVVASGHSLGKDFIAGGLVPYFLQVWGPCIVITTAPTGRQVETVMWGEIETRYKAAKAELPGRLLTTRIDIEPNWYALGFTTKETGQMVGKFQGFHSPRVFVIASEAQAISDTTYEQIDAILTGEIGLLIMIGNPLRSTGYFARQIKNTKDNMVLHFSCLNTPNYKENRQVIPGICSRSWVEKKREAWGPEDPRWFGRVLGQIPKTSIDSVFSIDLIEKMVERQTRSTEVRRGLAADVARFGDDETVIYGGTNGVVEAQEIYSGLSTTETAAKSVMVNTRIRGGNFIAVDADGVGSGTIDTLYDMNLPGIDLVEIHSQGKPIDNQFYNLKAEMWFAAKDRAERGDASIPNDEILKEELLEVKFFINKKGKIQIESKEDIKERLGRSPDRADAWVYFQWATENASPIRKKDRWSDSDEVVGGNSGVSVGSKTGAMAR